jgi:hypothetical protein
LTHDCTSKIKQNVKKAAGQKQDHKLSRYQKRIRLDIYDVMGLKDQEHDP